MSENKDENDIVSVTYAKRAARDTESPPYSTPLFPLFLIQLALSSSSWLVLASIGHFSYYAYFYLLQVSFITLFFYLPSLETTMLRDLFMPIPYAALDRYVHVFFLTPHARRVQVG